MKRKSTIDQQRSLLLTLDSIRQEIELGYWPGVRVLCERMGARAKSLQAGGYPSFQETQRMIEAAKATESAELDQIAADLS